MVCPSVKSWKTNSLVWLAALLIPLQGLPSQTCCCNERVTNGKHLKECHAACKGGHFHHDHHSCSTHRRHSHSSHVAKHNHHHVCSAPKISMCGTGHQHSKKVLAPLAKVHCGALKVPCACATLGEHVVQQGLSNHRPLELNAVSEWIDFTTDVRVLSGKRDELLRWSRRCPTAVLSSSELCASLCRLTI